MSGAGWHLTKEFKNWEREKEVFEPCAGVNSGTNIEILDRCTLMCSAWGKVSRAYPL